MRDKIDSPLFKIGILVLTLVPVITQAITIANPLKAKSFEELIDTLISFVITIGILVAPIVILYAGFLFLTSGDLKFFYSRLNHIEYWILNLQICSSSH